ncbi:MAG: hypothetical protein IT449_04635 [Phycisphaerales bacterium]|nr:hypothetical protein [Phycisphaerales bacterium]
MQSGSGFEVEQFAACLKEVLPEALSIARRAPLGSEYRTAWEKRADGHGWSGTTQADIYSPELFKLDALEKFVAPIEDAFFRAFPKFRELYGTATLGWSRINGRQLLHGLLHDGWNRFSTWDWKLEETELLITELIGVCGQSSVKCWFVAPLLKLRLDPELASVPMSDGMELRALTDAEATSLYGGPSFLTHSPHRPSYPQQAAVFGSFVEDLCGGESSSSSVLHERVEPELDRIVSALRILKAGPVGIEGVHAGTPCRHPALARISFGVRNGKYVPSGTYDFARGDIDRLEQVVGCLSNGLHESLRIACERISSASLRSNPSDRLLDAVIGMESVLLREAGRDEYRGEMRYRFSARYAFLHSDPAVRSSRFDTAKDVYDHRSRIVHGSGWGSSHVRLGTESLPPDKAADRACEALRELILKFLPSASHPEFLSQGYWDRLVFGMLDEARSPNLGDGA